MKVPIEISDDSKYCFSNGKMCQFVRTSHYGKYWSCSLFVDKYERTSVNLKDDDNFMLMRCDQCLELEKSNKE